MTGSRRRIHLSPSQPGKDATRLVEARTQEKRTLALMVGIYCKGSRHRNRAEHGPGPRGAGLCPQCQELVDYSFGRIDRCPHMSTKTFCSACPTHCYRPDMRERVRKAMAYAGPRMLLYDPLGALRHLRHGRPPKGTGKRSGKS